MAKAELLVLPNELLHLICTKLCSHCRLAGLGDFVKDEDVLLQAKDDKEALCNLSLTSRRLRDIAQPILYHTLHIHSLDPRGLHKRVRCSQIHLSDCVKSATIDHDESRVYTNNDTISLKSLAVSFNLGHIKFCPYSRLKLSLLELLLAQIRNVEFLDLTINYRNHKDAFAALRHPDIEGNPMTILSSLQGLRLRSYRMRNHFTPEMVQGLFVAAPNLTHLHLDQCTGPVPRNMHLGTVRHLKISDAYFQQPDIQNLLASCENLESFKITGPDQGGWDQGGWNQFMRDAIKPKDVVEALSSHRDSLRELYMRLSTSSLDRSFWENATIKSLTEQSGLG